MAEASVDQNALPSDVAKPVGPAAAPVPGTPEYEAAMAAKYEQHQSGNTPAGDKPAAPVKPEGIPDKFWDAEKGVVRTEDLLKSYQELEKQRGQQSQEPPKADDKAPQSADQKAAKDALAAQGLDINKFSSEFQESGSLSEASYKELEAVGIPKATVDAYITGQQAIADARDAVGYDIAGGKEAFQTMASWAAANLTMEEKVAFNKATSGSEAEMRLAVAGLRAQYEAANGKAPTLAGGKPPVSGSSGYESRAQMVADMKDPRYAKDPAFRAKVEAKLANTTAF